MITVLNHSFPDTGYVIITLKNAVIEFYKISIINSLCYRTLFYLIFL